MKKVSIIIPIYNAEKHLTKCINSVINQTYQNIEIILIDDGSTDNSSEICKEYQKKYTNIIYKKIKNSGVSHARNTGISLANGDYIFFIDSDDYIEFESIELLVKNNKPDTLIGLVPTGYNYNDKYTIYEFFSRIMQNKCFGNVWGYLFEKNKINFEFDENTHLMEDSMFLFQYLSTVENIQFVNNVKYNYMINNNGITKSKNIDKIISNVDSFDYSLNSIRKIITNIYPDKESEIVKLIEHKKIKLVESELIKIVNKKELTKFINNQNITRVLKNNHSENCILIMVKKILLNKNYTICMIYIFFRRTIMKVKNKIFDF